MPLVLAIHGGAWNIPDALVEPSHDGIRAYRMAALACEIIGDWL